MRPDDFHKGNGVLRYTEGTADNGWSTTAMAYASRWNATNQIPERAVDDGQLSYFGTEDPTDGGRAQRYSLSGKMVETNTDGQLKANVYLIASQLDLFNNFTFNLYNPIQGDQFHQHDVRLIEGGKVSYTMFGKLAGLDTENTVGTELRNDDIHLGLYQTYHQVISQHRPGRHGERKQRRNVLREQDDMAGKLRTVAGVREDLFTLPITPTMP